MKTQISSLRSGSKDQIINKQIDYSVLPKSTSHVGYAGSTTDLVNNVWMHITKENPKQLVAEVNGIEFVFTAKYSVSGKTVSYWTNLTKEQLSIFGLTPSKKQTPYLSIQKANIIIVGNGKNSFSHICPSLVHIK